MLMMEEVILKMKPKVESKVCREQQDGCRNTNISLELSAGDKGAIAP